MCCMMLFCNSTFSQTATLNLEQGESTLQAISGRTLLSQLNFEYNGNSTIMNYDFRGTGASSLKIQLFRSNRMVHEFDAQPSSRGPNATQPIISKDEVVLEDNVAVIGWIKWLLRVPCFEGHYESSGDWEISFDCHGRAEVSGGGDVVVGTSGRILENISSIKITPVGARSVVNPTINTY